MLSSARPVISRNMPKNNTLTRTFVIVTDGFQLFGFQWAKALARISLGARTGCANLAASSEHGERLELCAGARIVEARVSNPLAAAVGCVFGGWLRKRCIERNAGVIAVAELAAAG